MFEKDAKKWVKENIHIEHSASFGEIKVYPSAENGFQAGAEFGYNKAKEEYKEKCRTAYIKGIRAMANALKDYDRTDGAWTDYFEHTVEEVLKRLLKEIK